MSGQGLSSCLWPQEQCLHPVECVSEVKCVLSTSVPFLKARRNDVTAKQTATRKGTFQERVNKETPVSTFTIQFDVPSM